MNQKLLTCKYLYNSIEEDGPIYILKTKNNSTQTINGYELELKNISSVQMTYNSSRKCFESAVYNFYQNSFTTYYVIVDITIIKPENNNISFYQLASVHSRNDDTITFPANSELLVDTINWIFMTSTVITNGISLKFNLQSFNQSENVVDIPNLIVNISFKSYPIY